MSLYMLTIHVVAMYKGVKKKSIYIKNILIICKSFMSFLLKMSLVSAFQKLIFAGLFSLL